MYVFIEIDGESVAAGFSDKATGALTKRSQLLKITAERRILGTNKEYTTEARGYNYLILKSISA